MLEAVVFDFDGVVVNSEPLHYRAFCAVLGESEMSFDWYLEHLVGFDDRDAFGYLIEQDRLAAPGHGDIEAEVARYCRAKQEAFNELIASGRVPTIPGALELIGALRGRMPIALASGATRADIEQILAGLGLEGSFDAIVTADDVARSKPHPQSYTDAAALLCDRSAGRVSGAASCLAIEDTATGLASARSAGLRTLALRTTTRDDEVLADAERILDDLVGVSPDDLQAWYA